MDDNDTCQEDACLEYRRHLVQSKRDSCLVLILFPGVRVRGGRIIAHKLANKDSFHQRDQTQDQQQDDRELSRTFNIIINVSKKDKANSRTNSHRIPEFITILTSHIGPITPSSDFLPVASKPQQNIFLTHPVE